jgi:formate dehydrogenase major subunit
MCHWTRLIVYTTFHHAKSKANVLTSDLSDWATNCPEYKVTAVEVVKAAVDAEAVSSRKLEVLEETTA